MKIVRRKPTAIFLQLPDIRGHRRCQWRIPHWSGSLLALRRLQGLQAATTLVQVVRPPRDRGTTWSKVRSAAAWPVPQYWQLNLSRRKTLKRVKAGLRICGTYSFSAITEGSFISMVGELIETSYSETMVTRSRHTAFTASCQDQSDKRKIIQRAEICVQDKCRCETACVHRLPRLVRPVIDISKPWSSPDYKRLPPHIGMRHTIASKYCGVMTKKQT
jgi:hypothetical protein